MCKLSHQNDVQVMFWKIKNKCLNRFKNILSSESYKYRILGIGFPSPNYRKEKIDNGNDLSGVCSEPEQVSLLKHLHQSRNLLT